MNCNHITIHRLTLTLIKSTVTMNWHEKVSKAMNHWTVATNNLFTDSIIWHYQESWINIPCQEWGSIKNNEYHPWRILSEIPSSDATVIKNLLLMYFVLYILFVNNCKVWDRVLFANCCFILNSFTSQILVNVICKLWELIVMSLVWIWKPDHTQVITLPMLWLVRLTKDWLVVIGTTQSVPSPTPELRYWV